VNKERILKKGARAAKIATIATVFLAITKGVIGFLSGSLLLVADAIHSAVDIAAIFSSWFGLKISQKKYNKKFPYGYYKAENFATIIASFFIFYAAYEIFLESYDKFFVITDFKLPLLVLTVPLSSAVVSYAIAIYEDKVGKEINSQSLVANAQESKVDVVSSLVIFGGILLAYFKIGYIEGIVGMGLSFMIIKIGYQNAKIAIYSLMDASPDKELEEGIKELILGIDDVKDLSGLKLRQSGLFVFGEATIKLLKNMNVARAHDISEIIEIKVKESFSQIDALSIHIEPYKTDSIKLLIPVKEDNGLDSGIVMHFGRAKYLLFITLEDKKISSFYVKENIYFDKDIQVGLLVSRNVLGEKVDAILTKEIGEIAFHLLRDSFVEIYLIKVADVKQSIEDFNQGNLKKLEKSTHLSNK